MKNPYHLETPPDAVAANRLRIATLISDLSRTVDILTVDIEHEEERAKVNDVSDLAYPTLARSLRTRRDNISTTVASLEAALQETSKAA